MFGSLAAMYMVGGALSIGLLPPAPAITPDTSASGWVSFKFAGSFSRFVVLVFHSYTFMGKNFSCEGEKYLTIFKFLSFFNHQALK